MESAFKPVSASTLFDSYAQRVVGGTRGDDDTRHLVLRAEAFDIHVKVSGKIPNRKLAGQILSRGAASPIADAQLHLIREGDRLATTQADKMGEFTFSEVPAGLLSLQVDLPHLTVVGALNLDE